MLPTKFTTYLRHSCGKAALWSRGYWNEHFPQACATLGSHKGAVCLALTSSNREYESPLNIIGLY